MTIGGTVVSLFVVALIIVVGVIAFASTYPTLDGLRDSDFSASANTTIAAIDDNFYDAIDLVRIVLIIMGAVALIGVVVYGLGRMG